MDTLCKKYGYAPDKEKIDRSLEIIAANLENVISPDVLKECFSIMDVTTLHTDDTVASVSRLVDKVNSLAKDFPEYPRPASVCVYPNFASVVAERRADPRVHVTAVSSCFPTAQSFLEVKVRECELAVEAGADEIDIVLALNSFLAGDYDSASREIREMKAAVDRKAAEAGRTVILKVILETGLLVTPEKIAEASFLAMEAGADFIKTSTGKVSVNATPVSVSRLPEAFPMPWMPYAITRSFLQCLAANGLTAAISASESAVWPTPSCPPSNRRRSTCSDFSRFLTGSD